MTNMIGARMIRSLFLPGIALALTACVSTTANLDAGISGPSTGSGASRVEDLVLVDCLLPGQIRRLGTSMTYLAPRRSVKTTQRDCAIRGGEYVLFDRSDYRSALQALLPQARAGDAVAQTYVGEIHERGLGLSAPDFAAAATWYAKAAEAGHRPAQIRLGSLYERGLGVPRNQAAALNWYRRATGLDEDRLIFESDLKARREAFRRELALRNQVAASLKQQLRQAQQVVTRGNMDSEAPGAQPRQAELQALIESQQREAESLATQKQTELKAVQLLQQQGQDAGEGSSEKAAQMGKLELTLRQQIDGLRDTSERLVMRD